MNEHIDEQLSAYLDDELDPGSRAAAEAHLAVCPACAAALHQLKAVKAWAPTYGGLPTSRDLWPAIQRGLDRPAAARLPWHGRRVTLGIPLLLAAGIVLVLLSATVVWMVRPRGAVADSAVAVVKQRERSWNVQQAALTDNQYEAAVAQLEALLASNDSALEPGTLAVIRKSLARIDQAIRDAEQAIARDSSNNFLRSSIEANKQRKLALLRTAAQAVVAKS